MSHTALHTATPVAPAPAPAPVTAVMTLADAIDFLSGHEHSTHLLAVETYFLKRLMDDLDAEEKAECYYYLLRCRLKKSRHFETVDAMELYRKMRAAFHHAERQLRRDVRRKSPIAEMQLRVFYRRTIFYFGTLENLYRSQNFDESARRAAVDRMDFRRHSTRIEGEWVRFFGLWFFNLTSRYGHSFLRWGITTGAVLLGFSTLYRAIDATVDPANRIVPVGESLLEYLYFTVVTFTTLGYGDLHPHTAPQMVAACAEVMIGYFMLGIFMNLMSQKM